MAIYRYGDVNGDGVVDMLDAILVLTEVAGGTGVDTVVRKLSPTEIPRADVNRDADVTSVDSRLILQHIRGINLIYDTRKE